MSHFRARDLKRRDGFDRKMRKFEKSLGEHSLKGPSTDVLEQEACSSFVPDIKQSMKPPPGLRGKALGLWYRDRKREGQPKKKGKKERVEKSIPLEFPMEKLKIIKRMLSCISMEAPPTVSQIRMNNECSSTNITDKYKHLEDSDFKRRFLKSISGSIEKKIHFAVNNTMLNYKTDEILDREYEQEYYQKNENPEYIKMVEFRKKLPAFEKREELIETLSSNQVILVSGETGCGKTTQVPQFILDHEMKSKRGSLCHILCTQPRRISAISVAERVAQERAEKLGESVGYQIRLEHTRPRSTGSILFCTTGILLQIMQSDPVLQKISHIVLDEIHERDTLSDFAITILRDVIKIRKDLKIILMSATLNAEQFSKYFDNCPTVHIPGFTYPVKEYYIEDIMILTGVIFSSNSNRKKKKIPKSDVKYNKYMDLLEPYVMSMKQKNSYSIEILNYLLTPDAEQINLDLILELLKYICKNEPPGAILVFLPGWDKISALINMMNNSNVFPESRFVIIPLHSMMPTATQRTVFHRPPKGVRKIVIATNIAETSITIDDVVYVVDCGMIKMKNFDTEHNITTLQEEWVSLANARQRRGRAGRVQEGVCYHFYSRPKEMMLDSYQLPEMLRTRLEEVILQMKVLQLGKAEPFLMKVMDPPSDRAFKLSLELLINMNALDSEERLTPLGYHLAHLPIDPQPGKMILLAALFGCVDPITTVAASLSHKDAFFVPLGQEEQVKKVKMELSGGSKSDHLLMAEALSCWREAERCGRGRSYTSRNFLAFNTLTVLRDMKKQFVDHLYEMKFLENRNVESEFSNYNSNNPALLKSIICAGLYPNVAVAKNKKNRKGAPKILTAEDGRVSIHPRSVNAKITEIETGFLAYFLKIKSSSVFIHDATMVFPIALIFFCHSFTIENEGSNKLIVLNKKIRFSCKQDIANLIQELRAWLDWLLEYKVSHPGVIDWNSKSDESTILQAIIELLTAESQLYLPDYSDNSDYEFPDY